MQGNCAAYTPIGLLLLAMTELQGAPTWVVHLLKLMLLAGRVLHALGLGSTPKIMFSRRGGMVLLIMVGMALMADGSHYHVERGLIYSTIVFGGAVAGLKLLRQRRRRRLL